MRTSNLTTCLCVSLSILCLAHCVPREKHTYCENFTNKDSLIQCVVTNYDEQAFSYLHCCHEDSNMNLYGFLIADSSGSAGWYRPTHYIDDDHGYGLSDTVMLFYESKSIAMGCYIYFDGSQQRQIAFPDSIYDVLRRAFYRFGVSVWDKEKYQSEYDNLDSLICVTLSNLDTESYDKLRLLVPEDTLLPIAIKIADKIHYPIACYDVYYSTVCGLRLPQEDFDFAYSYLSEAADSMYYPAVYLKACLCLTGAYFPIDTILGKELLEQCQGSTSIPFWQQYYKPVVYGHLLQNNRDKTL